MVTRRTVLQSMAATAGVFAISGRAHAADTIKIGMAVTQSGAGAAAGQFQFNGGKLGVDHVNAAGGVLGRQLELVVEDDQGTNPGAVSAFNRLAERSDLAAFYGPARSTQILAIEPDIRRIGKVMMMQGQDPKLTHLGNEWLFRATVANDLSSKVIAQAGVKELGKTKWAIVHSTDTFGKSASDNLIAALAKLDVTPVLVQGFAAQQNDLTPVVLALKQSGAEMISTSVALETDVALLLRQMKELGLTAPVIGGTSLVSPVTLKLAGPAADGCYGATGFEPGSSPQAQKFYDDYKAAFGEPPAAGSAYDGMMLLARAIADGNSTEPEAIRRALHGIKDYAGVEGKYSFDANGDGLHALNLVKIEGGKTVFVKSVEVQ